MMLRPTRRDESGATAVLAATLAMLLVGISAFTLDFGRAYVSKRNLQTGADSGSLAAASFFTDKPGSCATLSSNVSYAAAARARAAAILEESRGGAAINDFRVACNAQGELTVDLSVTGSTPVAFGGVYGANSITTQREAQATVEVLETVTKGLRPYMVCSTYAPPVSSLPTAFTKVEFPSGSNASGTCPHDSGNWFTLDCPHPGNSNNGNPDLADATRNGCSSPVSIVKNQNSSSPEALYTSLRAACPDKSKNMEDFDPDCLTSNPGNIDSTAVSNAWDSLIGDTILLPIFCAKGPCNPAGWVEASSGGNNTMYPVHKFAAVKVCGYHWGNVKNSGLYPGSDPLDKCTNADATAGGNENYLLLAFVMYQSAGSTEDSGCALDGLCDTGARQVRLTR